MNQFELSKKIATALPTYDEADRRAQADYDERKGAAHAKAVRQWNDQSMALTNRLQELTQEITSENGIRDGIKNLAARFVANKQQLAELEIAEELDVLFGVDDKAAAKSRKRQIEALAGHCRAIVEKDIPARMASLAKLQDKLPALFAERDRLLRER